MKKCLLCFAILLGMMMAVPSAVFASDTLVNSDGDPVSSTACNDGWKPATVFDLIEEALLVEKAKTDPSIVVDDEKYGTTAKVTEPAMGNDVRTISVDEILSDEGMNITPMSVSSSYIGATRYSKTSGKVSASAGFTRKASKATCSITLQEKYNGSWRTATGLSVRAYVKTQYNTYSIAAARTFTLKSGKVYRAKIVFSDKNSSGTYYKTRYTGSF